MEVEEEKEAQAEAELDAKLEAIMGTPDDGEPGEAAAKEAQEDTPREDGTNEDEGWVTDDVLKDAKSYGLTEKEVEKFGSVEAFEAAGALFDRQSMQAQGKDEKDEDEEGEEKFSAPIDIDSLEENDYDENSIAMGKSLNAQSEELFNMRSEKTKADKAQVEREFQKRSDAFHDQINEMDPKFYGNTRDKKGFSQPISRTEDKRRAKLHKAMNLITEMNPDAEVNASLFARADRLAFEEEREGRMKSARKQSSTRRTTGRTSASNGFKRGTPDEVADTPEAQAIFARHKRENGE